MPTLMMPAFHYGFAAYYFHTLLPLRRYASFRHFLIFATPLRHFAASFIFMMMPPLPFAPFVIFFAAFADAMPLRRYADA